ncbi:MAG: hypothetical protein ACREMA_06055 [Longimicrobiales bacterium]
MHFCTLVDAIRPSWRPESSIQGVIPEGGEAPNLMPERAVVDYYIRFPRSQHAFGCAFRHRFRPLPPPDEHQILKHLTARQVVNR